MKITETRINGDFRSEDCTTLLKQADIVVTNPPFSLFRDFFKWLMDNKKDFIIVGNPNATSYKEVFPYFREEKLFLGFKPWTKDSYFITTDEYKKELLETKKEGSGYVVIDGEILARVSSVWFTTINIYGTKEPLLLTEKYSPEKYPKYDNYDAIEVSKVNEIPCDYYGVMGVPITYMYKHNPDRFEIVDKLSPVLNNRNLYERILIRRKSNS